ncbi:hypothetical protein [Streptomyces sp. B6B3]|uniref:hypothetical protein n=1 Tax=Streptomyces sp. B6B3 TaxID=3153570 RepID=UPI00325DF87F
MSAVVGLSGPTHLEREQWLTVRGCKKVLAVVSTLTYVQRLLDVFPLLASDLRIEVSFTVAPHPFGEGVVRFLEGMGCPLLPWDDAVRTEFDLALAAGHEGIDQIRAPLILLSHGAGTNKLRRVRPGGPAQRERLPGRLSRDNLVRDGRVVPAVLGLAHRDELATLARGCPEALEVARVIGDPAHDRLAESLRLREKYRAALGLRPEQKLVLTTCTWGQTGTFGRLDTLLPRLLGELPADRFRTIVTTHPNISAGHGWWQIDAWLAEYRRRGIAVMPPDQDWRAPLAAADFVIGDHGSVTAYATVTSAPVLLAAYPHADVHVASPAAALAGIAPALVPTTPLDEQLRYAAEVYRRPEHAAVAARITSEPGRFNERMRRLIYRQLGIGEPAYRPVTEPAPLPASLDAWTRDTREGAA